MQLLRLMSASGKNLACINQKTIQIDGGETEILSLFHSTKACNVCAVVVVRVIVLFNTLQSTFMCKSGLPPF